MPEVPTPDAAFPSHRFSWDGFSFLVPEDWNLSQYSFLGKVSSLQMQDDCAIRLELEWTRPRKAVDRDELKRRFEKSSRRFTQFAASSEALEDTPPGWVVMLYSMPDKNHLITAFWLSPGGDFFCFFKLHFAKMGRTTPMRTARLVTAAFVLHETGPIPWECYDVSFTLSRDFRLVSTAFQSGSKLMAFEWRLRRLHLWQFSLADIVLKKQSLAEWGVKSLKGNKAFRGATFSVEGDNEIGARRKHVLGRYDELGRLCLRYKAAGIHLPHKNSIVLVVFNYRAEADLSKLVESVQCFNEPLLRETP